MDTREKSTRKTKDEIVEDEEGDDEDKDDNEDEDDEGEGGKAVDKNVQVVELEQITVDYIDDDEGEKFNLIEINPIGDSALSYLSLPIIYHYLYLLIHCSDKI